MSRQIDRRQFIKKSVITGTMIGMSVTRAKALENNYDIEAIVIGSGFGGAVASLRLAQAGIETLVLERGLRWPITQAGDTFCTKENPDGRSAWLRNTSPLPPPFPVVPIDVFTGVFDQKAAMESGLLAVFGAGVGGGSLIYGGITVQPNEEHFYEVFPQSISYEILNREYFPRVRKMLNATPIPDDIFQTDAYLSSRILQEQVTKAGLKSYKPDIAINWDIVRQEIQGKKVPSIIAGETYYGTNSGAKNSLDQNYLRFAEESGYVEIKPLHVVTDIEDVRGGYRVVANQIDEHGNVIEEHSFVCRYLFLAAGSLGTSELLLRAQSKGTLNNLSDSVGKFWGPNGDSNGLMLNSGQTNINLGSPGVIAVEDFNNPIAPILLETFQALPLPADGIIAVLGQAISKPEGYLTYNKATQSADLFWPSTSANIQKNADAIARTYALLNEANGTSLEAPVNNLFTAHAVGGAVLGAVCSNYGEVFGNKNLFVVDGSLIPGSAGCANPSLTIAALAEQSLDHFLNSSKK
jgi:cholesterol oxidase